MIKVSKIFFLLSIGILLTISSCQETKPRLPVSVSSGVDYTQSIELSKKINQHEERRFRKYVDTQDLKFERSNFGFLYHIENNSLPLIKSKDEVLYLETVEKLDGEIIYPQIKRILLVDHQQEIKGIHEGLKLMGEGSSAIFIFPSHQAFGFHGDDNKIKTNTPLIYKIEVLKINNNQISN